MKATNWKRGSRRGGFTLLEVIMSTTILGVLARSLILLSGSMGSMSQSGGSLALLQQEASKAQEAIMHDLRRSGLHTIGAKSFPHVFENGVPGVGFEAHGYAPASQSAQPGEYGFGPHRALVFLSPSDLDGDDRPDMDLDVNGIPDLDGNRDGVLSEDPADLAGWIRPRPGPIPTPAWCGVSMSSPLPWSTVPMVARTSSVA
ncbi:MAG: prepilin-type N-terminal cleavage/methylation domain-containing protein [Planctomycetota bacterium]